MEGSESFYLLKSEPDEFSIDDLAAAKDQTEPWDGVRNYQVGPGIVTPMLKRAVAAAYLMQPHLLCHQGGFASRVSCIEPECP